MLSTGTFYQMLCQEPGKDIMHHIDDSYYITFNEAQRLYIVIKELSFFEIFFFVCLMTETLSIFFCRVVYH